ncbi:hypothetical protein PA07A_0344 [Cutibacterium acnes P07A]|nr:hypothetical protein [Cutibacterium acnes P07A]
MSAIDMLTPTIEPLLSPVLKGLVSADFTSLRSDNRAYAAETTEPTMMTRRPTLLASAAPAESPTLSTSAPATPSG